MTHTRILLALSLVFSACSKEDRREAPPEPPVAPSLSKATQLDLAKDIDEAELHGTWLEIKRRWQGQRVQWTVTRHAALCVTASDCNVSAFPVERPAKHGWLPGLQMSSDQFAKIQTACGAADCEILIDGVLDELRGSEAEPAAIHFKDVVVMSAKKSV